MQYKKAYDKWRFIIIEYLSYIVFLILFLEIIVFVYFTYTGIMISTPQKYFMKYTLFPTATNVSLLAIGNYLLKKESLSEEIKDYIPILCLVGFCLTISLVHNYFLITASIFMVPLMLSSMYGSKKITTRIFMICIAALLFSAFFDGFDSANRDKEMWNINEVIALILLLSAYLLTIVMMNYSREKEEELRESIIAKYTLEEALKRDPLTGLYNHTEFYRYLETLLDHVGTKIKTVSLVVIDIDNFKNVNDTYGHEKGNIILLELSKMMTEYCGEKGRVCRYGGEEFVIVFPDLNQDEVWSHMEHIRKLFAIREMLPGERVTISIGIAEYEEGITAQKLFEKADAAMYTAKAEGRNRSVIFQEVTE